MDYEQLAKQFWQDGYLVIPDYFDAKLMARVDGNIQQHFGENPEFSP